MSKLRPPDQPREPGPVVSFRVEPAGRETLEAISRDKSREVRSTKHYGDRISNAPGAVSPRIARALDTHPEVTVSFAPAGRATFAAIEEELESEEGPSIEISDPKRPLAAGSLDFAIEHMCSFVIRARPEDLENPLVQSELLSERLLPFLPIKSPRDVARIEVRPLPEAGSSLFCVWCRVP